MGAATENQQVDSFEPQSGAQEAFLSSSADIVIYGGAAGGGKTWALIVEPLRHIHVPGFTAVIFRRNATQVFNPGGLWSEVSKLYPLLGGIPRLVRSEWIFPSGATVRFGHLSDANTMYSYQGSQQCLECCEENTPVLMKNGSYKAIKDIVVGDEVQTLQGGNVVVAVGERHLKECVEVELSNGKKQIQSTDHRILTGGGWFSYEDCINLLADNCNKSSRPTQSRCSDKGGGYYPARFPFAWMRFLTRCSDQKRAFEFAQLALGRKCAVRSSAYKACGASSDVSFEPTVCHFAPKFGRCSLWKFRGLRMLRGNRLLGRQRTVSPYPPTQRRLASPDVSFYKAQRDLDSYCGWSPVKRRVHARRPLILREQEHSLPVRVTTADIFEDVLSRNELSCVRSLNICKDSPVRCSFYLNQCDELSRSCQGDDQAPVLILNDVVVHTPIDLRVDDPDNTQRHIQHILRYEHPYTGSCRTAAGLNVQRDSVKITPIGKKFVVDITVLPENQYITQCGIVNMNCWDELTHFTETQFIYMLSRNRSTCGVKPYIRATTNPDADSWVRRYVDWWIDPKSGYPIKERSGVLRYMARIDNELKFADTPEELIERYGKECAPKSLTFIPANLYDNRILMDANPEYLANLKSLSKVERERLLFGNWNIQPNAGNNFRREWVSVIEKEDLPKNLLCVRGWDLASTPVRPESPDPDYTVGVLLGKDMATGRIYVIHGLSLRDTPGRVEATISNIAAQDGIRTTIGLPQDPGQAGKAQVTQFVKKLARYPVKASPETGDKEVRFRPFSAACENGLVSFVRGDWNEEFFDFLEKFKTEGVHDDHADAISRAYTTLHEARPSLRISSSALMRRR